MSKILNDKREHVADMAKNLLAWIVVTALSFVYWMAVLLLASLFLLNVWHVTFERIIQMSLVLMVVTSIGYAVILVKRLRS